MAFTTASAIGIVPVDVRSGAKLPVAGQPLLLLLPPAYEPLHYRGVACCVLGTPSDADRFAGLVHNRQPKQPLHLQKRGVALIAVVVGGATNVFGANKVGVKGGDALRAAGAFVGTFITPTTALVEALLPSYQTGWLPNPAKLQDPD